MARRSIHRLSDRTVRTVRPGLHPDGGGLYLQVTVGADGTMRRSWLFRFATADVERAINPKLGRERRMGLGAYPDISLADARQAATDARKLRQDGLDPIDHRGTQRAAQRAAAVKAITFDECRNGYLDAHRAGWRSARHASDWDISIKTYVSPIIGVLPVAAVDTAMVMRVLEPNWATKTETMSRVRGRIEAVLAWASVRGYRSGPNPAQWKNHLDKLLPARAKTQRVEHYASLPFDQISSFMERLRARTGVHVLAAELLILTAARSGEVLKATWSEFDLGAKLWTVPAAHTKTHKEHRVPLSDAAVAVIEKAQALRHGDLLFPIGHQRLGEIPRQLGYDVTVHGMRATFRTWAAETTAFPHHVVEMALGHAIGDRVEAAYQRGDLFDKRRRLMDAWAKYCATAPAERGKVVVPLARGG
jgi:integrase